MSFSLWVNYTSCMEAKKPRSVLTQTKAREEKKDAAKAGASQFEPAPVSNGRERRGGTSREKHSDRELIQPVPHFKGSL